MPYRHISVMVKEVLDLLNCSPGKTIVDGTLGGGGHARAILQAIGPRGVLIGIDQDPAAIAQTRRTLRDFEPNIALYQDNFASLPQILRRSNIHRVDGIVLDLGLSLYQLEESGRGFSFLRDEPLDMRMNPNEKRTAEGVVNRSSEKELADVIAGFGEESWARRIAKRIVAARQQEAIVSSRRLADIVTEAIPAKHRSRRIHPATRTFQALRIAVNQELENLKGFLAHAVDCLNPGGRLCIVSFHSLEDRIVKEHFKAWAQGCQCPPSFPICTCGKTSQVKILTKKPLRPGPSEVQANPMARSAKLRAVEKLGV
jgi:16S rRNA (cytosine1402-N4)-methyltransferase